MDSSSKPPLARLMAFVDGGYLREECTNRFDEEINYQKLKERILSYFNANCNGKYIGDLVRIYYYDAIVDRLNPKYDKQNDYFNRIKGNNGYQVRLGKVVPTGKDGSGQVKQKGVDVLLAVDMITKAYSNQYEFAILIAGDSDFLEVVNAVKDSGKRVFGMYFRDHIADDLFDAFDARIEIENFVNELKTLTV
ncbi:MAG: NYN domain-containing protein [Thaumarchaeota archaeon]|nr:NYN domain-containing protein [Nitrososphaerota archaeon]